MIETQDSVPRIVVRVPGAWGSPRELARKLPRGYGLRPWRLLTPAGDAIQVDVHAADGEFPRIFVEGCRGTLSARERRTIDGYRVNVLLAAAGGSLEAARRMAEAAAAVVRAGGAGVFVDNSGVVHAGHDWVEISGRGDDLSAFEAFVSTIGARRDLFSVGMHVFGLRDAVLGRRESAETDHFVLLSFLGYSLAPREAICEGDFVGDLEQLFRIRKEPCRGIPAGNPMHNPYGRWRLVPEPPCEGEGTVRTAG